MLVPGVAEDWNEVAESETAMPLVVVDGPNRVGGDGEGVDPGRSEEPWRCWIAEAAPSSARKALPARYEDSCSLVLCSEAFSPSAGLGGE